MTARTAFLASLAETLPRFTDRISRIAIDGVDGAGKTIFADDLAGAMQARDISVIRASVDGFHHPRAVRYARGRQSPEGFFLDSYDYPLLHRLLLDPLGPGGTGHYRVAGYDHRTDRPVDTPEKAAPVGAVLLFDGLFLHRPELKFLWDFSVFLDVPFAETFRRMAARDGSIPDPASPSNHRYVEGQRLYLGSCRPRDAASMVIDNTDPNAPKIVKLDAV